MRLPGARGEVWFEDGEGAPVDNAPDDGSVVRIEATHPDAGAVRGFLRTGGGEWAECVCPNGEDGFVWTRKRVVPVEIDIRFGDRRIRCKARGIEDESAGYHPRHTVWSWSAGVGTLTDGREVGWNLVEGVNDPPERSRASDLGRRRAVRAWTVDLRAASRRSPSTTARASTARPRPSAPDVEKRGPISYSYRQPFGTFTGTLPGGLDLASGMGVMESHDAHVVNEPAARYVGEWTLVSWRASMRTGERVSHGGAKPSGELIYLESGRMAVQIQHDGRAAFGSTDWSAGERPTSAPPPTRPTTRTAGRSPCPSRASSSTTSSLRSTPTTRAWKSAGSSSSTGMS